MKTLSSLRHFRMAAAAALLAGSLCATTSHAALIAYEDFESYTPGAALSGLNGGTGFTGAWTGAAQATVQSMTLVDPNGLVSGGSNALRLQTAADGLADITNAFSRGFAATSDTLYVSYLVRVESFENDDFLGVAVSNGATGDHADTLTTGVRNQANNPIFARVASSANGTSTNVLSGDGSAVPDGTDFLVVAKLSKVNGSLTYNQTEVFVNPTNYTEPAIASASAMDDDPAITQLSLLTGRYRPNQANDVAFLDSFRVATTFGEAVGLTGPKLQNATIDAFADAHIQSGSNGNLNFANDEVLQVKNGNPTTGANFSRKAYIQFDVSALDLDAISQASLSLTVAPHAGGTDPVPTQWEFALYGLRDDFVPGAGKLDENWGETALNGNNAPGNDTTDGGAVMADDVFGGTFLSTFMLTGFGVDGMVITLDDQAILDFLKSDTDGVVSFILVRTTQETVNVNSVVHAFYSSESTTGFGPKLNVATIVPEPSVAILGLMSLAGLGLRRRRAA